MMSQTAVAADNTLVQHHIQGLIFLKEKMMPTAFTGEITPEQSAHQSGQSTSHILWNAGHLVWAIDHELVPSLGGEPVLPGNYHELFNIGSKPTNDPSRYPSAEELLSNFSRVIDNAILLLNSMSDEDLSRPVWEHSMTRDIFPTVGALLNVEQVHAGYHIGQISLLRRTQGLPSGFGM